MGRPKEILEAEEAIVDPPRADLMAISRHHLEVSDEALDEAVVNGL